MKIVHQGHIFCSIKKLWVNLPSHRGNVYVETLIPNYYWQSLIICLVWIQLFEAFSLWFLCFYDLNRKYELIDVRNITSRQQNTDAPGLNKDLFPTGKKTHSQEMWKKNLITLTSHKQYITWIMSCEQTSYKIVGGIGQLRLEQINITYWFQRPPSYALMKTLQITDNLLKWISQRLEISFNLEYIKCKCDHRNTFVLGTESSNRWTDLEPERRTRKHIENK